jgi:hypothetical protein
MAAAGEIARQGTKAGKSLARILVGIVFLALSGCCLLSAVANVAFRKEDDVYNVSYVVGLFLPSLICLIVGLFLLTGRSGKQP